MPGSGRHTRPADEPAGGGRWQGQAETPDACRLLKLELSHESDEGHSACRDEEKAKFFQKKLAFPELIVFLPRSK